MSKPTNVNKVNEALVEIVNLASAAILSEDERVKRQALGDIAETVGWVCGRHRRHAANREGVRA